MSLTGPLNVLQQVLKNEQTLVIVGGQFGDEGKGKFVALLAQLFDWIVRFSGGRTRATRSTWTGSSSRRI